MSDERKILSLLKDETVYIMGTNRQEPSPNSIESQAFLSRYRDADHRAAEALAFVHESLDKLNILKTDIARGKFLSARKHIESLIQDTDSNPILSEVFLEKSRISFFECDWTTGVALSSAGLKFEPALITRITLLQVRSSCFYELGAFELALADMDQIRMLGRICPSASVLFLSDLTNVKIEGHLHGESSARKMLDSLWSSFLTGSVAKNRDLLVALCRTEIELARMADRPVGHWARLCFIISQDSGDDLYEALAYLDLEASLGSISSPALDAYKERFFRVRYLIDDANEKEPKSRTGQSLKKNMSKGDSIPRAWISRQAAQFLYVQEGKLLVNRVPFSILKVDSRLHSAVTLAAQPVTKQEFFEHIYQQKYSPHLHDGTLRTMMSRMRTRLGLKIVSRDGKIHVQDIEVL